MVRMAVDQGQRAGLVPVLGQAEREELKAALVEKRAECDARRRRARSLLRTPFRAADLADRAECDAHSPILAFGVSNGARVCAAINEALARIDSPTFGICMNCGDPIGMPRLRAVPWTRGCIDCKDPKELLSLGRQRGYASRITL